MKKIKDKISNKKRRPPTDSCPHTTSEHEKFRRSTQTLARRETFAAKRSTHPGWFPRKALSVEAVRHSSRARIQKLNGAFRRMEQDGLCVCTPNKYLDGIFRLIPNRPHENHPHVTTPLHSTRRDHRDGRTCERMMFHLPFHDQLEASQRISHPPVRSLLERPSTSDLPFPLRARGKQHFGKEMGSHPPASKSS